MRLSVWVICIIWLITGAFFIFDFLIDDNNIAYKKIQNNIRIAIEDQMIAIKDLRNSFSEVSDPLALKSNYNYALRVFDNGKLVYWNDNKYVPDYIDLNKEDSLYYYSDSFNKYIISHKTTTYYTYGRLDFYAIMPVFQSYKIENSSLKPSLNYSLFEDHQVEFSENGIPITYGDFSLFSIKFKERGSVPLLRKLYEFFLIISVFISIIFVIAKGRRLLHPIFYYIILFVLIPFFRGLQLYYFPGNEMFSLSFFNQTLYTSKWWLPNLGDFIINLILYFILVKKGVRLLFNSRILIKSINQNQRYLLAFIAFCGSILNGWFIFRLVWNLIHNSQISLDISNSIQFDFARLTYFLIIIFSGSIYFYINHLCYKVFLKSTKNNTERIGASIFGIIFCVLVIPKYSIYIIGIQLISWLLINYSKASYQLIKVRYATLFYLIIICFTVSIISAVSIYKEAEFTDSQNKRRFVTDILINNDIIGEYYINQLQSRLGSNPFIRSRFLNTILADKSIEDMISREVSPYLDKYLLNIHMYDANGSPYGFTENHSLEYWQTVEEFNPTSYENIFFGPSLTSGRHKYIAITEIAQYDKTYGYLVLEFTSKKYLSNSVFPSLLIEQSPQVNENDYDYAYYNKGELQQRVGLFPFESKITKQKIDNITAESQGIESDGYDIWTYKIDDERQLVIVSKLYPYKNILANCSFIFTIFLFVVGSLFFVLTRITSFGSYSLANKIQLYIGIAFIFPVVIISGAILNVLNTSYREEINRNYEKRANNVSENLVSETNKFLSNEINRDKYHNRLFDISNLVQSDIIIYDRSGRLIGTNRPEVFNLDLLSQWINPKALNRIVNQYTQTTVLNEKIGTLDFRTAYAGIYSFENGDLIGIVALPFFDSKNHLSRQQIEVFSNLVTLFTLIFIVTILIGNFSLGRLVSPLKLIAERLSKTNYLEIPQELHYKENDEIGKLVFEYNKMVSKLEKSKNDLARVQKETVWKEIARQVAHEIKNPLTPMRLKIQQMQRLKEKGSNEYNTLASLLTQIDTLASIADSFSAFGQMPAPNNVGFNLSELILQTVSLHNTDNLKLNLDIESSVYVFADPNLLSQILNNLMLNAIQSISSIQKTISVKLKTDNQKLIISIKDNGRGINEELKDNIFKPYFSTKEKGSGIGLALAKKGIEQAGGTIWYESEMGKGTIFFISLPIFKEGKSNFL